MTYEESRNNEIKSQNIRHVEEFVKRYDPNKKTVIFLPGGLGSQLERTTKSFSEGSTGPFATPIVLNPGDETPLDFIVKRSAVLDESGNPLAHTWGVEIGKEHQYIGMRNIDGVLLVKTPAGEIREYLISLGDCWFQNNPPTGDHEISIGDESPQPGVPAIALCE